MPLPGDSESGDDDSFVFGPEAPSQPPEALPEEALPQGGLWADLMARWIGVTDPAEPPPQPSDEVWGG